MIGGGQERYGQTDGLSQIDIDIYDLTSFLTSLKFPEFTEKKHCLRL